MLSVRSIVLSFVVPVALCISGCGSPSGGSVLGKEGEAARESDAASDGPIRQAHQAIESSAVMFLWNDRPAEAIGVEYSPNGLYRSHPDDTMAVTRTGVGQYTVEFGGPHRAVDSPLATQVVAYGADDTRCKFRQASIPFVCLGVPDGTGVCTRTFVACFSSDGTRTNSQFVIQLAGWPGNNRIGSAHSGFVETADGGSAIQRVWTVSNGRFVRGSELVAHNSAGEGAPDIRQPSTGRYVIDFPDLGSKTPAGLTQVTAIGADAVHCKPSSLPGRAGPGSSALRQEVQCFISETLASSDFIVSYDTYLTRRGAGYQGARADAISPTGTFYTPSRSFNSGAISGSSGVNIAHRWSKGVYVMEHTALSAQESAAYVVAYGQSSDYCKLLWWIPWGNGTTVWSLCFDASGNPADTRYFEMYQAGVIGPS